MKTLKTSLVILSLAALVLAFDSAPVSAMGRGYGSNPEVVPNVDISRYVGEWHEIAHAPNWFQNKCLRSMAKYEILNDAQISVFNTCYKANGGISTILGYANILNKDVPAKLLVHFKILKLLQVKGDYWIVDLGKDYDYAVVSGAGKSGLFILSREAPMAQDKLDTILASLKARGFEVDNLVYDRYDTQAE